MAELTRMLMVSIEELEKNLGVNKWLSFISACEKGFEERLQQIATRILANPSIKAIFVSGPTASGKTTFSHRLAQLLQEKGNPTRIVSLDDYYLTTNVEYDANGRPDFESIHTLDTGQMVEDFQKLLAGKPVQLPTFDFRARMRIQEPDKKIVLHESDKIIVEGLHGLSPEIAGHFSHQQYFGVFIMPWCTLLDGRQLLGSSDLRKLRRIARDVQHRGSTALSTLDYWPMIDHTEENFFPGYLDSADEYINSSLAYEFTIIAPLAASYLQESLRQYARGKLPGSVYRINRDGYADLPSALAEAKCLLAACNRIPISDLSLVPPRSILNEFITQPKNP